MARNNSRCASNIYVAVSDSFKPDYKFAGDTEFYFNSVAAAQNFLIGFLDWKSGMGWLVTLFPLGPLIDLVHQGATATMIVVSLLLYLDISKLGLEPLESFDAA